MSSLHDLQQAFMQALLRRHDDGLASHPLAGELNSVQRLGIYRNNTFSNLQNAMLSAYPVVARLVGEDFFRFAATEYVYHYPSSSGDLHRYGDKFAQFLREFPQVSALHYLPDVARLEWACHRAFFAADHPPLDLHRLAEVPVEQYEELCFQLHPACRLLESDFPIDTIWRVNQEGFEGDQRVDLSLGGARLLVRRPHHLAEVVPLAQSEWHFLNVLASGQTLGKACEAAMDSPTEFDLKRVLQRFVNEATLVDFTLP